MKSIFRRFGLPHLVAVLAVALVLGSGAAYAANEVKSKNIKNNTIKSVDVKDGALTGTDIADGTITGADVATDTLTAVDLAANSVGTSEILDSTITTNDVALDTLTAADLAANSVGESEIATDGVAASEIQDNSIDGGEIVDGTIDAAELGTITQRSAVSANIAAGANGSVVASCLAGEQFLSGGNDGFGDVIRRRFAPESATAGRCSGTTAAEATARSLPTSTAWLRRVVEEDGEHLMRFPMRARGAPSAMAAVVAALALATGGVAYGASVVGDGSSTADVQPDKGTPGVAPGGTADVQPGKGTPGVAPGGTAGLQPGASQVPADADVDTSDRGAKGAKPTKDRGVKNAPVTTG